MLEIKTKDNFQLVKKFVEPELKLVDKLVLDYASSHVEDIPEVTKYITQAGGKRLRPILNLFWAKLYNQNCSNSIKLATAVEFIHTATLLHDDVVDGSPKRRNKPTANLVWDNKVCILVGDYLFSQAFKLMVETGNIKALELLSNAAATIAESEVMQLDLIDDSNLSKEDYFKLIEGKTAVLFASSCASGAIVGGADQDSSKGAYQYGLNLGISFQIIDDVLDYTASDKFGKKLGNDFVEGKITLPIIMALQNGGSNAKKLMKDILQQEDKNEEDFKQFCQLIIEGGGIEESIKLAKDYSNKAIRALDGIRIDNDVREMLSDLARAQLNRIY